MTHTPAEEVQKAFQKYGFKAGFLKLALLAMLSKGPTHGYALMKDIESITEEGWKPSPGSIYPALRELEKEGLISPRNEGRRKTYKITPAGRITLKMALDHASSALKQLNKLLDI